VLSTLCVFNAITIAALGFIAVMYVDGIAGPLSAAGLWLAAGTLVWISRRLRRAVEW